MRAAAAFVANLGLLVFIFVYAIAFTWAFARVFGLPASAAPNDAKAVRAQATAAARAPSRARGPQLLEMVGGLTIGSAGGARC